MNIDKFSLFVSSVVIIHLTSAPGVAKRMSADPGWLGGFGPLSAYGYGNRNR